MVATNHHDNNPTFGSDAPAVPNPRRPLSWRKKIAFSAISTVTALFLIELILAICGVKPRYLTEDRFVGFRPGVPLFIRDGEDYRTNPSKRMFFNDQRFPVKKSARSYRIFCLGGSTTFGHPYHDSTSFVGWLRARLQDADPDRDWQVINCGGISYASYRIHRLMAELKAYEPDLFVFYEGHNEFLEDRSYGDLKNRGTLSGVAELLATRSRIGAMTLSLIGRDRSAENKTILSAEVETILEHSIGPEKYHRDTDWHQAVHHHFQESLERICDLAASVGAKMIVVKPASNLRDFTPFKSESGQLDPVKSAQFHKLINRARRARDAGDIPAAAAEFQAACQVNSLHAMTQWEAGNALYKDRRFSESTPYFQRAIDEDVCPLRADSHTLAIIESVARDRRVPLVDFPEILEDELERTAGHRLPGNESFLDHVHPTIDNNRLLGWAIYDELASLGVVRTVASNQDVIDRISARVLKDIDAGKQSLALIQVAQVLSWAGKNEEALKLLERAENLDPAQSNVFYYRGRILEKSGDSEGAFSCYLTAVARNPQDFFSQSRLGWAHLKREEPNLALEDFRRAIECTPDAAPASFRAGLYVGLGATYASMGRPADAERELQHALQISPDSKEALRGLESLRSLK